MWFDSFGSYIDGVILTKTIPSFFSYDINMDCEREFKCLIISVHVDRIS